MVATKIRAAAPFCGVCCISHYTRACACAYVRALACAPARAWACMPQTVQTRAAALLLGAYVRAHDPARQACARKLPALARAPLSIFNFRKKIERENTKTWPGQTKNRAVAASDTHARADARLRRRPHVRERQSRGFLPSPPGTGGPSALLYCSLIGVV